MLRVEKGPCKLGLGDSSVLRVERIPCKLDLKSSSVLRVEKGLCKLESRGFKCAKKGLNKDHASTNQGIL